MPSATPDLTSAAEPEPVSLILNDEEREFYAETMSCALGLEITPRTLVRSCLFIAAEHLGKQDQNTGALLATIANLCK
jgi:hypothetical protein